MKNSEHKSNFSQQPNHFQIEVYNWGAKGDNQTDKKYKPNIIQIKRIKITKISCGYDFALVLDSCMNLYSIGSNQFGQLGYSNCAENMSELKQVKFNKKINITQIRCGFTHAIVFNDREAYGWGQHQYGALGYDPVQVINPWMPRKLPLLVSNTQVILDVTCGNNTSFVNVSGDFYAMGDNKSKQLGLILKKSYFDFQRVQISKQSPVKKQSKLVCIKAGDGFTVGVDESGYLYGAGQFSKFSLFLRHRNSLPNGFFPLEEPTEKGYRQIKNIKHVSCGTNLIIHHQNGQVVLYGYHNKPIKIRTQSNLQVLAHCKQYLILKQEYSKSAYLWKKFSESNVQYQQALAQSNEVELIEIDCSNCLFGSQGNGKLLKIHAKTTQNKEQMNLHQQIQGMKRKIEIINEEEQEKQFYEDKFKLIGHKYNRQNDHTNQTSSRNEVGLSKITQLSKQVAQQKEIIRLYQLYVARLQLENRQLKQKLFTQQLQQIKQQTTDSLGTGLGLLKEMLQNMLREHQ